MNKVNIIITHKCNLRCKHCYMNAGNNDYENYEIMLYNFKNTIHELQKLGTKEVMLTGGECTTSPILFEILDYCKKTDIKTSIFTNGILFNKKICTYVDDYCLSLDGLKKNHNKLRDRDNAFDNTIKTIKYLIEQKKNVTVQVTVTKLNLIELPKLIDLLYSIGVKKTNLCCLLDEGRSIDNNLESDIDLEKVKSIITNAYRSTGYNVIIHSNIFNDFDTNFYLKTKSLTFPLWIDLVDNCFYLIKQKSNFCRKLSELSKDNIHMLNEGIYNYILDNTNCWNKKEYYILENEILKLFSEGDGKNG